MTKIVPRMLDPIADEATVDAAFRQFVNWWRPYLGMNDWQISLTQSDEHQASCVADPKYKIAELYVSPRKMVEQRVSLLELEAYAVHELRHALLWVVFDECANPVLPEKVVSFFEERQMERDTKSLMRVKYKNSPKLEAIWRTGPL